MYATRLILKNTKVGTVEPEGNSHGEVQGMCSTATILGQTLPEVIMVPSRR